jgi:ubiquinone/menaquinone biosynthesis C-methylase UbiE
VDGSEEQIKHCTPQPNITYRTGLAESTGLPDSSVDLVTVATALHW